MGKVLVTGATGFIGGRLATRLASDGQDVRVVVRDATRLEAGLGSRVEVLEGDICDPEAMLSALRGIRVVFHCAANAATWATDESYYRANVEGVRGVVQAMIRQPGPKARLVHLSSVDVYGFPEQPREECHAPGRPAYAYGSTKWMGEKVVASWGNDWRIPYTILRPCNVVGPGSPFVTRIGRALSMGVMLRVDGGRHHAGLLDVDQLLDCMIWSAADPRAAGQVFNVRSESDATWRDFLDAFRRALGSRSLVLDLRYRAAMEWATRIEAASARLVPGREPPWHRLLVQVFGRTCGHSNARILRSGAPPMPLDVEALASRCACWFLESRDGFDNRVLAGLR